MNKVFYIIKATISDISFANNTIKLKKNKLRLYNIWVILLLFCMSGFYAYSFGAELYKINMTYVLLSIFSMAIVFTTLTSGIFKAGTLIYLSKDNDMLLSMPIKRLHVYLARVIKFLIYEYIQTAVVMIPVVVVYALFEHPTIVFYISTLLYILALPIGPVILSLIIGYFVEVLSSRMKNKNIAQTIISFIFFSIIMYFSLSLSMIMQKLALYAPKIASSLNKAYYPLELYISSVLENKYINMIYLCITSVVVLLVLVKLFSINYFKIISRLSEKHTKTNYKIKNITIKSKISSLVLKELKRYFSSSVYILNTMIFPIFIFFGGIYTLFKDININQMLPGIDTDSLPVIIGLGIFTMLGTASTTCTSISMEGSKITILKSLPVNVKEIFIAKILMNVIVMLPLEVLGLLFLAIGLRLGITATIVLTIFLAIAQAFIAVMGLIINLIFPKMNALNDTVIVKQSASVMINMFGSMIISGVLGIMYYTLLTNHVSPLFYLMVITIGLVMLSYLIWLVIKRYGVKRFNSLY